MRLTGRYSVCRGGRRLGIGQQARFNDFQVVVAGEIHHEIPCHRLVLAQRGIHHHTAGAVEDGGHAPGGIAQAMPPRAGRAKLAHDASEPLGPIAGAKNPSIFGFTQDENFFKRRGTGHGCAPRSPQPRVDKARDSTDSTRFGLRTRPASHHAREAICARPAAAAPPVQQTRRWPCG